ncbi:MAG: hypothetical protein LBS54_01425 [Dysgonamonadaceae bacterium]|jgi:hypothetical protein|nr:hypothetical protein [Dysgonamonadaceae bacterium]
MDYKKLIIDGYNGQRTTRLASYFFLETQKAVERKEAKTHKDFFESCKVVINDYKTEIEKKYQKRLHENDWVLNSIYQGRGVNFDGEIVTDLNDERIKDTIKNITEEKRYVEGRDYKNDRTEWLCILDKNGNISDNFLERVYKFDYPELISIENGLLQAEQELIPTAAPDSTKSVQQITLPDNLLQALEQAGFIENAKANPLQWNIQKVSLCAYFVDCYFAGSNPNDLWKVGEILFNVKNLRQAKYRYTGNKKTYGKPKGYEIIDTILDKK